MASRFMMNGDLSKLPARSIRFFRYNQKRSFPSFSLAKILYCAILQSPGVDSQPVPVGHSCSPSAAPDSLSGENSKDSKCSPKVECNDSIHQLLWDSNLEVFWMWLVFNSSLPCAKTATYSESPTTWVHGLSSSPRRRRIGRKRSHISSSQSRTPVRLRKTLDRYRMMLLHCYNINNHKQS